MSLKSRFTIENVGMLAASAFYAIVGILSFVTLALIDLRLVHFGIIGIFSLFTAYGLFRKRTWSIWLVVILSFIATIFSVYTLYNVIWKDLYLSITMIAYFILTWVFTIYTAAKRNILAT